MEIPTNTNTNPNEEIINAAIKKLAESDSVMFYKRELPNLNAAREIGRKFADKGYYAKIIHFCESWKGFQSLIISKNPIRQTSGLMVYDEFIR